MHPMLTCSKKWKLAVSPSPYPPPSCPSSHFSFSQFSCLSSTPSSPPSSEFSFHVQNLPTEIQHMIMKLLGRPSWTTLARVCRDWNVIATPFIWRKYKCSHPSHEKGLTETDIQALQKNAHHIQHLWIHQFDLAEIFFGIQDLQPDAGHPLVTCTNLKSLLVSCFRHWGGSDMIFYPIHTVVGTHNGGDMFPDNVQAIAV